MVTSDQALRSWYMGFFQLPVLPERALLAREARLLHRGLRRAGLPRAPTTSTGCGRTARSLPR